jgi:hypothetical protein
VYKNTALGWFHSIFNICWSSRATELGMSWFASYFKAEQDRLCLVSLAESTLAGNSKLPKHTVEHMLKFDIFGSGAPYPPWNGSFSVFLLTTACLASSHGEIFFSSASWMNPDPTVWQVVVWISRSFLNGARIIGDREMGMKAIESPFNCASTQWSPVVLAWKLRNWHNLVRGVLFSWFLISLYGITQ